MGDVLLPVEHARLPALVLAHGVEVAVRDRGPRGRHGHDHLGGALLAGEVEAGEVVRGVLRLALRPDLRWAVRVALVGGVEVEAAARGGCVGDGDGGGLPGLPRTAEVHLQRAVAGGELQRLARLVHHGGDVEVERVEDRLAHGRSAWREGEGGEAFHLPLLEVERELEAEVFHLQRPVPAPDGAVPRQREGGAVSRCAQLAPPEAMAGFAAGRDQTDLAHVCTTPLRRR